MVTIITRVVTVKKILLLTTTAIFISILFNTLVDAYPLITGDDNRQFDVEYNQHGAVLSSEKLKIYLGRSCDAYSSVYGYGHWGQANGGMLLFFPNRTLGFPRQGIYLRNCSL